MWSQMETMSNLPDSSPTYHSLSARTSTPVPRTASRSQSTRTLHFLSPGFANSAGDPSDPATTLAHTKLKAASTAADRISAPALAPTAGVRSTWAGVGSLGQVAERNIPPHSGYIRPQSPDFSGLSSSPVFRSPQPNGVPPSTDYPPQ